MAEGDSMSMNYLENVNTTDLVEMLGDAASLSEMLSAPFGSKSAELEILEQPKQRGFRFRYSCEGPSHGGLPGENSVKGKKTSPTVQIVNYHGKARVEVSLVTTSDPPTPHAHSLVGKNVDGACVVEVSEDTGMTAVFQNLGIQHVTKKNVKNVLKERHLKRLSLEKTSISQSSNLLLNVHTNVDSERIAEVITNEEIAKIDRIVEQEAKNMNLSSVRLCFQAYLPNENGYFETCLNPVYSNPIYDSKAAAAAELKICRVDKQSGFVQGGEEVFLLCDKVQKEDIEVRFYEEHTDDDIANIKEPWEALAKFSHTDVHRQFAIVFKTPEYWNTAIEKPVTVLMELRRKSDNERSAPFEFVYKPREFDTDQIGAKRRKTIPYFDQSAPTTTQANDAASGPSAAVTSSAANPSFINPNFFNPYPAFAGLPFPGLFGNTFPSLSSFPPLFGIPGADGTQQQQYQVPEGQESSSSSNVS
ncbi:nuclear factor NF-kappa-B p100 subunit-like [Xenia sp. Carnegie-2017]|uniref:nuclear factor NF-kappa-B p100 subunit-like n=1 Tax=Xenia sp. Carnegie-2017 TaxID=2897299 RepID=UPI001F041F9E|nr:nuclear factor NF-kappa-B p100 subunit-like [Xenia sp. Carnegie-2017]